jgi:hypothetical protein
MYTEFLSENLKDREISEDRGEMWWEGVNWIHMAQDRAQRRALVNMITKPSGSIKGVEFLDWLHYY